MKKILLVEDDPFIRDITSIKLTEHNLTVLTAQNGAEALEVMKNESPDAVLLDLDLPDVSGLEVLKAVRSSETQKNTPVIIFSNNDDPDTSKKANELGVDEFFVKATTNFEDLYKKLASLIGE